MKFKTKIEITSEAANKNEALEIVGEYLSGYLTSGVDMKCYTRPVSTAAKPIISVITVSLLLFIGFLSLSQIKSSKHSIGNVSTINAVQAPLRTSPAMKEYGFKKAWETKQAKEALNHLKK